MSASKGTTLDAVLEMLQKQMESIQDKKTTGDVLEEEERKSKCMAMLAGKYIDANKVQVEAAKVLNDSMDANLSFPRVIGCGEK